ncbi:outer membrane beta-barrel protein [Peristeroidobacter soli]|jgi:OOP family OmpA-OmpF porin|uniref:outer membrane beta-barrel protein n=1 Tax=Peristeroidobacter soli TaxID=2497877 RepID=UPI00101DACBA|nr:outer membrane beta-barrel protein [Peristeroidobacter soli]
MRLPIRWLSLPIALCAVSPAAFARDPALAGPYFGGSIGDSTVQFKDDETREEFDADDTGFKVIAGYRIIDWVAVELNYTDFGKPVDRIFGVDLQADYSAVSVSALGMLPLGSNFDLFARLGVARLDADFSARGFSGSDSQKSTEPLFGIGAQFRANNLAIRIEYEGILLDADNRNDDDWWDDWNDDNDWDDSNSDWLSMLSLGFTYKFGGPGR